MSYSDPSSNSKVEILQHNINRQVPVIHIYLEVAYKANIDFILIQKPYIAEGGIGIVSHLAYYTVLSENRDNIRPRVAIFARKDTRYSYTARPDIMNDPDIIVL